MPSALRCLTTRRKSVLLPLLSTHSRVNQGFTELKNSRLLLINPESPLGFNRDETSMDSKASDAGTGHALAQVRGCAGTSVTAGRYGVRRLEAAGLLRVRAAAQEPLCPRVCRNLAWLSGRLGSF
ncbi:uncharacterized protein [Gossypium hirsutum]|uniref:Uncharacterized protein n=1 Tax=Gossypium hirsutum TaxID=3635 RepID=A0A1U8IEI6_GOSHI|nr:uncharacterized protein LOC107895921 [Gossypium hirsutum]